jgi:hypothetical protein
MTKIYLSPERRPKPHGKYWGMEIYEHDVCKEIGELAAYALERCGFEVKMAGASPTIVQRVAEATAWGADCYLPIHTNASTNGTREGATRGPLVLAYDHPMSLEACQMVYEELAAIYPGKGQGVRVERTFYEINQTPMLSVYPELAFHDNGEDAKWLTSNRDEIAEALCKGICRWYKVPYSEPVPPAERPAASGPTQDELDHMARLLAETRQERDAERDRANKAEATIASIKVLIEKHN